MGAGSELDFSHGILFAGVGMIRRGTVSTMAGEWIEAIGAVSGGATEHSACDVPGASYWQSSGSNPSRRAYHAELPAGLHFGCGLTPGIETVAPFGRINIRGPGATLVICPDPIRMTTTLAPGSFHSAGLSALEPQLDSFGRLADFAQQKGAACMSLDQVPLPVIVRLAMPIDPWFQGTARDLAREARALELLAVFEAALCGRPQSARQTPRSQMLAIQARAIVEADYASALSIAALARRVGCSPRTLSEAFRHQFGLSIGGYLTQFRIEKAALLLRQGMRPTEVAYRVGYSPAHLATAFKRQYGVSPSRWRR